MLSYTVLSELLKVYVIGPQTPKFSVKPKLIIDNWDALTSYVIV